MFPQDNFAIPSNRFGLQRRGSSKVALCLSFRGFAFTDAKARKMLSSSCAHQVVPLLCAVSLCAASIALSPPGCFGPRSHFVAAAAVLLLLPPSARRHEVGCRRVALLDARGLSSAHGSDQSSRSSEPSSGAPRGPRAGQTGWCDEGASERKRAVCMRGEGLHRSASLTALLSLAAVLHWCLGCPRLPPLSSLLLSPCLRSHRDGHEESRASAHAAHLHHCSTQRGTGRSDARSRALDASRRKCECCTCVLRCDARLGSGAPAAVSAAGLAPES